MNDISPVFWMSIISVITLFLAFVLYEFAMLLRESRDSLTKVNSIVEELKEIAVKARSLVDTGEKIINTVLSPMKYLGAIGTFIEELFKKDTDVEVKEEENKTA
jgi:hypothetical protein